MALPGDTKTSRKWWADTVKSFLGVQGPPTSVEMRQLCLQFYLKLCQYQDIFTVQRKDTLISGIKNIEHLFTSMRVIAFSNHGESTDSDYNVSILAIEKDGTLLKKVVIIDLYDMCVFDSTSMFLAKCTCFNCSAVVFGMVSVSN